MTADERAEKLIRIVCYSEERDSWAVYIDAMASGRGHVKLAGPSRLAAMEEWAATVLRGPIAVAIREAESAARAEAFREAAQALQAESFLYEKDYEPGPLSSQWGWRTIAETLRRHAAAMERRAGEGRAVQTYSIWASRDDAVDTFTLAPGTERPRLADGTPDPTAESCALVFTAGSWEQARQRLDAHLAARAAETGE